MKIEKTKEGYKTQLISSLKTKIASLSMLFLALSLFVQCTGSLNEAENNNNGLEGKAKGFFSSLLSSSSVDRDGNGLIEISSAEQLNNVRYNLTGTSYKTSASDEGSSEGCPNGVCRGYELAANIDFTNTKWGRNDTGAKFVSKEGWEPIANFSAIFDGNGFAIRALYVNRPSSDEVALFSHIRSSSALLNQMNLEEVWVRGKSYVAGLVAQQVEGARITNSRVSGTIIGYGDFVGGLVGHQDASSIDHCSSTASVTVENLHGNLFQAVGGLVGSQRNAHITNSYATGDVVAFSPSEAIGGLVGLEAHSDITNSYATSNVQGNRDVGGLVGIQQDSSVVNAYATGHVVAWLNNAGGLVGYKSFMGVDAVIKNSYATGLVEADGSLQGGLVAETIMGSKRILNSYWDKTTTGIATSDDSSSEFGLTTAEMKSTTGNYPALLGSCFKLVQGKYPKLYTWNGLACTQTLLDGPNLDNTVDRDGNGLIEISSAEQLNNVRYNLTGTSYKTSASDEGSSEGCPNGVCRGYELAANIDFTNTKWGRNDTGAKFVSKEGWEPIANFSAIFDGNGFAIRALYVNRPSSDEVALFSHIRSSSALLNQMNLEEVWVRGKSYVAGLVAQQVEGARITNSRVSGTIIGYGDFVGGLVGHQDASSIDHCSSTASVTVENLHGNLFQAVGGLVGSQRNAHITNSYATGDVVAFSPSEAIGGLVGLEAHSDITNSYATSNVQGNRDVGGLVGIQQDSSVVNAYATGHVVAWLNNAGGLVGYKSFMGVDAVIKNSYATGLVEADGSLQGGLVAETIMGSKRILNSYWDKTTTGIATSDDSSSEFGLTTAEMKSTTGNYPALLGSCFKLVQGKYPKLYTWNGLACTQTLLDGPNLD